ncbi:MAG TPA: hypothetical protein VNY05_23015 [Candidatus Acidoferrales bacterium]|nr:hypothetical protein [Candidatus Acidoferrales bacterium]
MTGRKDLLLAVSGLLLLAFVVWRIGPDTVVRQLAAVRIGIAIIVALSLIRLMLQTRSWSIALRQDGIYTSTGELMLVRLASQGIGYLTVLGPIASEPMKISLLRRHRKSATAATLVDTGVYWFASGLVAIAGSLAACVLLAHSAKAVASAVILASLVIAGLCAMARPRLLLTPLGDSLGARCPKWLRKASQIEVAVRKFALQDRSAIRQMFLLDLGCQVLVAAEVATVFWFLRLPFHAGTILGLEAANRMVKMVAGWLPARIGADESGTAGAFLSFGLPAASGLALALARRTRDLLACFIGLTWLAWGARRNDDSAAAELGALTTAGGDI